jgi:hypothetical protein
MTWELNKTRLNMGYHSVFLREKGLEILPGYWDLVK